MTSCTLWLRVIALDVMKIGRYFGFPSSRDLSQVASSAFATACWNSSCVDGSRLSTYSWACSSGQLSKYWYCLSLSPSAHAPADLTTIRTRPWLFGLSRLKGLASPLNVWLPPSPGFQTWGWMLQFGLFLMN